MAEEKVEGAKDHPKGCMCMRCGGGCSMGGCHHGVMHVLIKVAIILFVFCAGILLGELKGMVRAEHQQGYGSIMGGWSQQGYYGVPRMMGGVYPVQQGGIVSAPASTTPVR